MLELEVLLTESQLAEEFLAAFEQRFLPEKFFYWLPLSVQAWLDLCRQSQPYRNYARSYDLISKHAGEISDGYTGKLVEVIGLGAGQGDKDLLVLKALREHGIEAAYRPVDSSQALLEIALAGAAAANFRARGLKADLESPETFHRLTDGTRPPRLYSLLGNTLGALDPPRWLKEFSVCLGPQDRLLVDGEIFDARNTLLGYDNPENRRFAFAPLASLGLEEGRDGALLFECRTDARFPGRHFVGKYFRAARSLRVPLAGRWVDLPAKEEIRMSCSWKYSQAEFRRLFLEGAGLDIQREYVSDDGLFMMLVVSCAGK